MSQILKDLLAVAHTDKEVVSIPELTKLATMSMVLFEMESNKAEATKEVDAEGVPTSYEWKQLYWIITLISYILLLEERLNIVRDEPDFDIGSIYRGEKGTL